MVAHALGWFVELSSPYARRWWRRLELAAPLDHPPREGERRRLVEQITVGVAGSVAEEIEFGLAVPFEPMQLVDYARDAHGAPEGQTCALIHQCEDRARTILTERWTTVERLAEAQLERGRVEGDESRRS